MLTKFGLVIPVLERDSNFTLHHNNRYRTFLNRYERRLHSIMGPLDSVQKTETLFSKAIRSRIDYYLMTRNLTGLEAYGENDHPGITIRPAVFDDADKLYDLQKEYELEEVFLDPATFNEKECRARLRRDLKRQVVYLAESGGIPVAKAGTNARGYRVDQIGGVFTRACDRKRGIATLLMQSLLVDLGEIKEVFSLFVKKNNQAAINLYKKLGFDKRLDYRITYYAYP